MATTGMLYRNKFRYRNVCVVYVRLTINIIKLLFGVKHYVYAYIETAFANIHVVQASNIKLLWSYEQKRKHVEGERENAILTEIASVSFYFLETTIQ